MIENAVYSSPEDDSDDEWMFHEGPREEQADDDAMLERRSIGRPKKRGAVLLPDVEVQFILNQRGNRQAICLGWFFILLTLLEISV
jgi:hypothetical protein